MFLPPNQAQDLFWLAALSDKEARSDLAAGFVHDEDDYTSTLVGSLRRNINSYSQSGLKATSYMVSTRVERRSGCDAAIIVTSGGNTKITVFEAKLPDFRNGAHGWDYSQTATGLSHYSDQLQRQLLLPKDFAVFEIFYCDYPFGHQPAYMLDAGSSCIWRDDASIYDSQRTRHPNPWSGGELTAMLNQFTKRSFADMLRAVADCQAGLPISTMRGMVAAGEYQLDGHILEITAVG
jgi:hypothetical protein